MSQASARLSHYLQRCSWCKKQLPRWQQRRVVSLFAGSDCSMPHTLHVHSRSDAQASALRDALSKAFADSDASLEERLSVALSDADCPASFDAHAFLSLLKARRLCRTSPAVI